MDEVDIFKIVGDMCLDVFFEVVFYVFEFFDDCEFFFIKFFYYNY